MSGTPGSKSQRRSKPWHLTRRTFSILWDGHSVVGIVLGIALYVMFFCGGLTLWRNELHQWADPARRASFTQVTSVDSLVGPLLDQTPPDHGSTVTVVWPFADRKDLFVSYQADSSRVRHRIIPETGNVLPSRSRSAMPNIIHDVHFFHQLGSVGETFAGLACIFFLFILISGIAIHWKKLPADWHTFRSEKKLRQVLTDGHVVLGTIGLPFTVMYSITGAYFALMTMFYGAVAIGSVQGDRDELRDLIEGIQIPVYEEVGELMQPLSFDALVAKLPDEWPPLDPVFLRIRGWGDRGALAQFEGYQLNTITRSAIAIMSATTGEILTAKGPLDTGSMTATTVGMQNLHFGRFAGGWLKALFFLLAMATSAVILTGNVLWLTIRKPNDPAETPLLNRMIARLTVGVGCGLIVAIPLLLLTTRVLPLEMSGRQQIENLVFFTGWLTLAVAAGFGNSIQTITRWQLGLAGVLSLLVPISNGIGTGTWLWASAQAAWWGVFWVDAGFLLASLILLDIARRLRSSA